MDISLLRDNNIPYNLLLFCNIIYNFDLIFLVTVKLNSG
jgi:hypothetical protein